MFEILLGVSICITLQLEQCSTARFKFASNADFAIAMQICTFAPELICYNQAAMSCNGGPCLQDIYPVYVFCAASASADAQFAHAASLHITSASQPIASHCNSLHATLALHNYTTGSMLYNLIPDKQSY